MAVLLGNPSTGLLGDPNYTPAAAPEITSATECRLNGTVTLAGTGFTGATVTINGNAESFTVNSAIEIDVDVPGTVGVAVGTSVDIVVTTPSGSDTFSVTVLADAGTNSENLTSADTSSFLYNYLLPNTIQVLDSVLIESPVLGYEVTPQPDGNIRIDPSAPQGVYPISISILEANHSSGAYTRIDGISFDLVTGSVGSVSITGTETEGQTLTASVTEADGITGSISYQWQRSANGSSGWANIIGATSQTYTLNANDVDEYVRVNAQYTDDAGNVENLNSSASGQIADLPNAAGSISISGTANQGQTLTASITDADGISGSVSYQWQISDDGSSDWTNISGATSQTLTLTAAQVDKYVRVTAAYTDDNSNAESLTSAATDQIVAIPNSIGSISIVGAASAGQSLSAVISDADGITGIITYQWQVSDDGSSNWSNISGATSQSYAITENEIDKYVRVNATYTDTNDNSEDITSSSTTQISEMTGNKGVIPAVSVIPTVQ